MLIRGSIKKLSNEIKGEKRKKNTVKLQLQDTIDSEEN